MTVVILLVLLATSICLLRAAALVRDGLRYIAFVLMPVAEEGDVVPNLGTPVESLDKFKR